MKNKYKKHQKLLLAALLLVSYHAYSSPTLMPKTETGADFGSNTLLTIVAVVLLIPIYLLGKTLLFSAKMFAEKDKEKNNSHVAKTLLVLLFAFASNPLFAQDATLIAAPKYTAPNITATDILVGVIIVEALVILFFGTYILAFLKGIQHNTALTKTQSSKAFSLNKWWKKTNNFIPIEEEAKLDSGHSYDGIRELDNNIPSWFTAAFVICILVAITYLWRYHVSQSAPLQLDEYKNEMAQAALEKEEYLKNAANNIDENSVVMLDAAGIAEGKNLFTTNCIACHGASGASMKGGVGPNLTDAYWLHGGGLKDVFKTIKYGWPDKGMRSWKDQFSPKQIAQLASFVKSISNTNIVGGKDPQGEIYKEEVVAKDSSNAVKKDSATTKK